MALFPKSKVLKGQVSRSADSFVLVILTRITLNSQLAILRAVSTIPGKARSEPLPYPFPGPTSPPSSGPPPPTLSLGSKIRIPHIKCTKTS